ncbi:MAG: hypothetical protein K1X54_14170 [Flavobacteriales bacterium]|nr:hypothetical protein [Flavobacteriales bacterium]
MKIYRVFLVMLVISLLSFTTVQIFPTLTGETLDHQTLTLPKDCLGKKTIVGLAYSEKAQEAMLTWYEPAFEKFVAKVGMFDYQYDIHLYFIPMFIGLKQSLYESTLKKLRAENRKDLYPYVIFYKGELEPYESTLNMKDKSLPYLFVLDEKGQIIHSITGEYSEKKMEAIEAALEK